jgi:hypothetical protein
VRVIHSVNLEQFQNKEIDFKEDILKLLFKYYLRYFPWIHVEVESDNQLSQPRTIYTRFLDLGSFDFNITRDTQDWGQVQKFIEKIDKLIDRLDKKEDNWKKMPRSRDFPDQGLELIKLWRKQILNKLINSIEVT